jgi:hypothetical protein
MVVTADEIQASADRLRIAIERYEQFVESWPVDPDRNLGGLDVYLDSRAHRAVEPARQLGIALTTRVTQRYHESRDVEARYTQQARDSGRQDWSQIVAETDPIRDVARRVHTAGYEGDPESGEPGYLFPKTLCPAVQVSMNAGSSPVSYEDRIAQYRAVADRLSEVPEIVYYPGSGHDVSPSAGFPGSHVVYVDVDEGAMVDLQRAGFDAVGADATGYELTDGADVIVFRNTGLLEEATVERNLREDGLVLANDHLESASHVSQLDSVELIGILPHEWDGDPPVIRPGESSRSKEHATTEGSELTCTPSGETLREVDSPNTPAAKDPIVNGDPLDLSVFRSVP